MAFTDDPLVATSTVIRTVHLSEIRIATNAVQALAGQGQTTFTGGTAGTLITAVQINELRAALDSAFTALLLPAGGYTDTITAGVPINAIHFQELRNRVK